MTRPGAVPSGAKTVEAGGIDRWIGRAAATTVAGLAGIAGAISYSHMRLLAQDHGQAGWQAHAFPLSVDGIEIVASLVLLADRRAGRRSGWLPWAALVIGTAGSLAANVATAGPGMINRTIAGWPALSLLIAVKLLSGLLGQHPTSALAADPFSSASDQSIGDRPSLPWVPVPSSMPGTGRRQTAAARLGPPSSPAVRRANHGIGAQSGMAPGLPGITDLLPAARAARDSLQRDGRRLTRDALAARLRQNGHAVSNARVTPLLEALRDESITPPPTGANRAANTLPNTDRRQMGLTSCPANLEILVDGHPPPARRPGTCR